MELKTISEIRQMTAIEASDYAVELERELGIPCTISIPMLEDIRNTNQLFPADDFVVKCFVAFAIEHWESMSYSISSSGELVFSDPNICVLRWDVGGIRRHHLFLSEEQSTLLKDALTAFEANVVLDTIAGITLDALKADTENIEKYKPLLEFLGLLYTRTELLEKVSESLQVDESTTRFSSAVWFQEIQNKVIILAGCGGIGSYVAFLLSRMKPRALYLYDDDVVEVVNMAGQLYSNSNVGQYKVDSLAAMVREYSSYADTFAIRFRFTNETEAGDIMICGFDNMEARKLFFKKWSEHVFNKPEEERKHCLFIDGRLAAEELQVLCIRGDDSYNMDRYRAEYLFSDEDADETLCSYKQTTYMANMIGSIMVNLFTNFVANEIVENLRDLPFITSYDGSTMALKTQC